MPASNDKTRKAARQLASLIQVHMDEAGLSVAERERNVKTLERPAPRIVSARGKSSARVQGVPLQGVAAAR
jgi:hypothetical protein